MFERSVNLRFGGLELQELEVNLEVSAAAN